jgi:hypothetical protein
MYKLIKDPRTNEVCAIQIVGANTSFPLVPDNTDYQAYLKWLDGYENVNGEWVKTSDSNTPEPADE